VKERERKVRDRENAVRDIAVTKEKDTKKKSGKEQEISSPRAGDTHSNWCRRGFHVPSKSAYS